MMSRSDAWQERGRLPLATFHAPARASPYHMEPPTRIAALVLLVVVGLLPLTSIGQQPSGRPFLSQKELDLLEKQAAEDPAQLLDLAAMVEAKEGRRLLRKVIKVIQKHPQEMAPWQGRFASLLPSLAASKEDVLAIFSPAAPKQIARQIIYRRYLEQWHFDRPFPITIFFDGRKGKDLRVRLVLLGDEGSP